MTVLEELRHGDRSYRIYQAGTEPAMFGVFGPAVALWDMKRPPGGVACWRDYDIPDFRGWYGYVRLGRVIEEPSFDVVFEYWGTALGTICGCDLTGRRLSGILGGSGTLARLEFAYLRSVWRHRGIGVADASLEAYGRDHVHATFLDLVVGKTGNEPTHILSYCRTQKHPEAALVTVPPAVVLAGGRDNVIDLDQARAVRALRS